MSLEPDTKYVQTVTSLSEGKQELKAIFTAPPVLTFVANGYHNELQMSTEQYMSSGHTHARDVLRQVAVNTMRATEQFAFSRWHNTNVPDLDTLDNDINASTCRLVKIRLHLNLNFADVNTQQAYAMQFEQFKARYCNLGVFVNYSIEMTVDGLNGNPHKLTVYSDDYLQPAWWMGRGGYWLSNVFCLTWIHRIAFNRATVCRDLKLFREVFIN